MPSADQLNELTFLFGLATVLFILASALPQKVATTVLIVLVPFQAIDIRFGTSGMVFGFIVFLALLLRREAIRLPMLPHFLFLLLWYAVSMSLMPPSTYSQHIVYMYTLVSAILVFWLCYDLVDRVEKPATVVNVFIASNALVAAYCVFQLWLGPGERFVLFGIDTLHMTRVREDGRLTGPFQSSEITAQYLVIMQFAILHQFWYSSRGWWRNFLVGLALCNLALLIATGSRGEFLLLLGGAAVYLWLFYRRLGIARTIGLTVGGSVALIVAALIVVNFTQFGGLFSRLTETNFTEQGIPDTRQFLWPPAWEAIKESPIVGHGPRFRFFLEERGTQYDDHLYIQYPHNLYLFLLFTVGIPGLALYLVVMLRIMQTCWKAGRSSPSTEAAYSSDLARTGSLFVLLFLIDGLKIDQMRLALADYWHFWFGLCGVLVAVAKRATAASTATDPLDARNPSRVPYGRRPVTQ